jgi:REP-associated tyrosine transposase
MPRKPRIHYPGALYHVILRGNARQDIFFDDSDRCRFSLLVQEGIERFGHRVLAFCQLTNHVHMAIQVGDIPLSRIMQNLSFRYTRWVNWRRERCGHLFQGRYKAVLADVDTHLLELTAYIHLNPVRAGMVDKPENYPWSSHRAYLGMGPIPWLFSEYVLAHFSGKLEQARILFSEFVADRIAEGHREDFYGKGSIDNRVIGEDRFVEGVLGQAGSLPVCKPSLEAVIEAVTKIYGLREEDLRSSGQKRRPSEARSLAAWAVRELTDATLNDLAGRLARDASTLSAAIRRFEVRVKNEPDLAEKVKTLKKELEVSIFQA